MPLGLFRNRTFTISLVAGDGAISFGFFGAIIFLPLWFQVVNGSTPPSRATSSCRCWPG